MYNAVMGIHFIGLLFCFYAIFIIAKQENKEKANYMVVTIVCNIISLVGYMLELMSSDILAMSVAVKMQYLGKCFVGTVLLFTFVRYYKWKFPRAVMRVFWLIDIAMYFVVFSFEKHNLYYKSVSIEMVDEHSFFIVEKSPLYVVFMAYMLGTLLLFSYLCYKNWKITNGREKKILGKLAITSIAADIAMIFSILNLAYPYDIVPMILTVFTVVISNLIRKYGLFSTLEIAKDNLITNLDEGVIVRNVEGKFQYANPKAYQMIPQMGDADNEMIDKHIDKMLGDRKLGTVQLGERYYQGKLRVLYDDKQVAGQMITFYDVTGLHESNKEMERLKIEADNANRAKSSFLANMSHEIRTPINAILGMDEMILRETDDADITEYAINIKKAGETLLSLVSDILDFSKIESGKMTIIKGEYHTADVINDLVNIFSIRMRDKGLSFMAEVDNNIPCALMGDEVRIKQIVMNLLSNACKYTDKGYVKLKVSGEREGEIFKLCMAVEDTGIGIKEENVGRLFDFFERIEERRNRYIEGTGLGLNITRNLLKAMGSDIQVTSQYGKGSTFYFILEQEIADETPIGDISDGMKKRDGKATENIEFIVPDGKILVVDDNEVNLAVMKGLLKKVKVQVDTTTSGAKSLELVKSNKYHLIFMDHLMPEMDGIETFHVMKQMEDNINRDTPIVVLTANAVSGADAMYLSEGFDDYMTKPVDVRVIESMLKKYIPEELVQYQ